MAQILDNKTQESVQAQAYRLQKRILDVTLCLVGLPIVLLLMALLGLLVCLDSRGPMIFVQERVGKDGRRFNMYKLRTVCHNADISAQKAHMQAFVRGEIGGANSKGVIHKAIPKLQITRVGRILRKTSLDELPQLLNVLKGDMSLVGPRPNVAFEVESYQAWHMRRLIALPGITGLAQIRGRSQMSFDRIVEYDIEYIENQSLLLDLKILLLTIPCVLSTRGTR